MGQRDGHVTLGGKGVLCDVPLDPIPPQVNVLQCHQDEACHMRLRTSPSPLALSLSTPLLSLSPGSLVSVGCDLPLPQDVCTFLTHHIYSADSHSTGSLQKPPLSPPPGLEPPF